MLAHRHATQHPYTFRLSPVVWWHEMRVQRCHGGWVAVAWIGDVDMEGGEAVGGGEEDGVDYFRIFRGGGC